MMKRLTSILLALLMLVGMALAETSDDTLLGDWYGLWADTPFHLMLAENDEFQMSAGDFSCAGRWWQTEDGDYYLASPDMIGGMLLRETGSGLAFRFKQMEDMEILLARSMDEWTTPLVVRTDTPLEAFQGTWAVESARNGSERMLNLEPGWHAADALHGGGHGNHPAPKSGERAGHHRYGDMGERHTPHGRFVGLGRAGRESHHHYLPDGGWRHVCYA